MAPSTNFDKAEADREALRDHLDLLESELTRHGTTALTEAEVDNYLLEANDNRKQLQENHKFLRVSAPKDKDLAAHIADYKTLSIQATRLHSAYHGIKIGFPVTTATTTSTSSSHFKIKLPALELPKFGGNLQEWVSFRDMFITAVHNTPMTKVEKLTQLKTLLTGEAARQVRSIILSDTNYDIAWTSLQERYENNRELLFSLLRRLLSQQQISTCTAVNIRSLIDTSKECVRSLEVLSIPTQHWDAILIYVLFSKLDASSRELWEQSLPDSSIPSLSRMYEFLEQRARALAASGTSTQQPRQPPRNPQGNVRAHHVATATCRLGCNPGHPFYKCPVFQKQTPHQRSEVIKKYNHCHNCLQDGHFPSECPSHSRCKICRCKHHTMLHFEGGNQNQHQHRQEHQPLPPQPPPPGVQSHHVNGGQLNTGVLATAKIRVVTPQADYIIRSLVDCGSTNSYISERAARRLKLPLRPCAIPMSGLDNAAIGTAKYTTSFTFQPHFNTWTSLTATALVVKSVSNSIPSERLKKDQWPHLNGLDLADPEFYIPSETEILLGTEIFWGILENDKKGGANGQPYAIKSTLGWLVGGPNITSTPVTVFNVNADLDYNLRRFWEQEELEDSITMTTEEQKCEDHFNSTYKRDVDGRFIVRLPFKHPPAKLGSSRQTAVKRLISLERKYNNNSKDASSLRKLSLQWEEYKKFMMEYEVLGHMSLVPPTEIQIESPTYYIPHHCVFKECSTTTKLRVVFDASAATSNGTSLNDCMMVGPKLQDNITDIMLRFRTHQIAFTADITKMYRQIRVSQADMDLQRILWREHHSLPIKEYRLSTVTYGTTSAPYLAVKCLQQLAIEEQGRYPEAAEIARRDFYVDDTASGCATLDQAKKAVQQLMDLCKSGGMELRKWCTNSADLLSFIPEELRETSSLVQLQQDDSLTVKTLGIYWNPQADMYTFKLSLPPDMPGTYTKRIILSQIAKIYDPLGWLAPAIIVCKIFMQELWKCKADWDEILPSSVQQRWQEIRTSLTDVERVEIPRCVISSPIARLVLIGCSDASLKAISAVVYILCEDDDKPSSCHLLSSKTKVASIKHVTLPRLELNGSVLLAELLSSTIKALKLPFAAVRAYTDSTITLHWIKSNPLKWKPYVRRRVQSIQEILPNCDWYHIPGISNPADCASRGITAADLLSHPLWWNGSNEFYNSSSTADLIDEDITHLQTEMEPITVLHAQPNPLHPILSKFSSFTKLQRVIAYVFRFLNNWIAPRRQSPQQKGALTTHELTTSHTFIMRELQRISFPAEVQMLSKGEALPSKSQLLNLSPVMWKDGLLRVGGRLRHANIPDQKKYQIFLPKMHPITDSIIQKTHKETLHSGPSSTLATLQQRYWILNARNTVRHVLKKCVICARHRADLMEQVMGDLPYHRVNPSRPFSKVGVDYAGPISIKPLVRSKVTLKCWLAIFVCFSTRAVHIEVVSSLSTECFLAAFRRFISRRGKPSDVFSDCGTNFKGADKVLRNFCQQEAFLTECATQQIQWHFNPAGAPHFGGLWEAGVKSIKYHLVRVMGATVPTYEGMLTLVIQIEGILNSRPLIPASADPSDLGILTPAHFLIGDAITAPPEPSLGDFPQNRLKHWEIIQQQQQLFWKRWSSEFITRLQQRPKWCKPNEDLQLGHLVIIKDKRFPPLKWKMGRVIAVYPGADGHVRVATLKTEDGELTRPVAKLCLLPIPQIN